MSRLKDNQLNYENALLQEILKELEKEKHESFYLVHKFNL